MSEAASRGCHERVLCLVELDDAGVTDASLRALTFARSLAAGG